MKCVLTMREAGWVSAWSLDVGRPVCRLLWLTGIMMVVLDLGCGAGEASSSLASPSGLLAEEAWLLSSSSSSSSNHHNHHHQKPFQHHQHHHYRSQATNHKVRHHHELRKLRRRQLENRFQPKFTHTEYKQTVPENLPVDTSILQVHATDDDLDRNGLIKYSVSDPEHFSIDEGGILYNTRPLDFEHTNGEYQLYIYAEDQGALRSSRKSAMVPALIRVEDTPEPPYFDEVSYAFSVSESARKGTYVGTVVARDADLDFDTYKLKDVVPPGMFDIHPENGIITVGGNTFNDTWEFSFKAVAIDKTNQSSWVPVNVSIIDENTNKPVFSTCSDYDGVHVKENGTADAYVILVTATDDDHGPNGEITYSLLNSFDSFKIATDNGNGKITTTRPLDRDGGDKEFFLTVIAKDRAPPKEALQEACSFKVVVEDINDNPPIFDKQVYEQNIATDHSPDTPVLRVTATDMDAMENAEIIYSLQGSPQDLLYFSINNGTGFIKLDTKLDDDMADTKIFHLKAKAMDKGDPPMSTSIDVTINVVSSGSLPPIIVKQEPSNPSVPEDTSEGTDVVIVCASSNIPSSPKVFFTLLNGNTQDTNSDGTFAIRDLNGGDPQCPDGSIGVAIYVAMRNLDYESITDYKLILQVVNDQYARADVQIPVAIEDRNDNAPLLQSFDGAIVENSRASLITTIKAIDKDVSPEFKRLEYSFDDGANDIVKEKFELKSNGELWTRMPLDREESNRYQVPIQVTDGVPSHKRMTIYWITVQDMNDVQPQFDKEAGVYEVVVPENKVPGKDTGIRLVVIDPDIVSYREFQIVQGNEEKKFRIDSTTGEVLINKVLDYDAPVLDRNFTMMVRLFDGANEPVETPITIAVTNVNDLQPIFDKEKYAFSITENIECDKNFGNVSATDPDLPPDVDQNINYYLYRDELKNFTIGKTTGNLHTIGCLDREAAMRGTMTLYPRAMDGGGNGLDAKPATVTLLINDINDNHPYIQSPDNSYAKIMENADPSVVKPVIIMLDDWDTEEHGCPCKLDFESFTSADIREKFKVSAVQGSSSQYELKPLKQLDREKQKTYEIPFRTTDREDVTGTRYLTVEVGDENDSPMTNGASSIKVYNYQGQFPTMIIGSVYVTDLDDYDVGDKNFEIDASTSSEVDVHFDVDSNNGNITMLKGTPEGEYSLYVKVKDKYRNESAIGEVTITVVDLTEEAVRQSGSFRVAGYTAHQVLQQQQAATSGTSLYERLKKALGFIHSISADNVDIFTLRDVADGVDVRYNCHSSPYYTAARLNGLMMSRREELNAALGVDISLVNINECLYEAVSPCNTKSCQQFLRPNLTSPLVVAGDTTTMVGVDITEEYTCDCGALEPLPSECYSGFCLNGGECYKANNSLACKCPVEEDYGPRCELKSERFEGGYAWYEPLKVCENASLFMSFDTREGDGLLLYSGPTVPRPWNDYPRDFIYVFLKDWVLQTYMDMGTGTVNMAIPIEHNKVRAFDYTITWDDRGVTFEVLNCLGNSTAENLPTCKRTVPLAGFKSPSHLLNVEGPMQLGGTAAMANFKVLATSHDWTLTPPTVKPFLGCVLEFRHNDYLYDLNATDYDKSTFRPCDALGPSRVIMGKQSIVIIVVSLLCLILLVLLILCLARRGKKTVSYPELDGIVKETIGGTDLEGFGEKDMTQYDLKLLRVGPDGYLFNGEDRRRLPDVADAPRQKREAPLAKMPEGLSIGDFIDENIKKVDKDPADFDDVRHYCYEGDEMSIASLSSIDSRGSSESDASFDYKNDWGPRFQKLNEIYRRESDEEEDSEFEFPNVPKRRMRDTLPQRASVPKPTASPPGHSPVGGGANNPPASAVDSPAAVNFAKPEVQGSQEAQLGETSQPNYNEAVNPMASFDSVQEGEESWC